MESRVLVGLLRELPEHHRVPVVLRHVAGLSYAEISSVLECPVGTAKANVARGLDQLRELAGAEVPRKDPLRKSTPRKDAPRKDAPRNRKKKESR